MKKTLLTFKFLFLAIITLYGQKGTHLSFDGFNDYVNLGDTMEGMGDCTFETWIYLNSTGTNAHDEIISKGNVSSLNIWRSGGNKVWFHLGTGNGWFDSGAVVSNASIPVNQWTHIAVTWDESEELVSIYINGALDKQESHSDSLGSTMGTSTFDRGIGGYPIGFSAANLQNFSGSIEEVRVWNTVRTQGEIETSKNIELSSTESGLLAYYRFNTGIAGGNNSLQTTLEDITINGNDGTLNNFTLNGLISNWQNGSPVPNNALNFDGLDDYVNLGTNASYDFVAGTVEAWIKPSSFAPNKVILANRTARDLFETRWSLHVSEEDNTLGIYNGRNDYMTIDAGTIDADTWYHVAFVMTIATTTVYLDGINLGVINSGINILSSSNPILVGATDLTNSFPTEYFSGDIDDIRIWNVQRTELEINATKNCELSGNETGLVAYYNFNQGVAGESNSTVTTLLDAKDNHNGTLNNFALVGSTSNWLSSSSRLTVRPLIPSAPIVTTPVVYEVGDSASPLTASIGTHGTGLLWYTSSTGGIGLPMAPTPTTNTAGSTSFWVSSVDNNGCESARVEIIVNIESVLSISDNSLNGYFDIYPNPTSGMVYFKNKNNNDELSVTSIEVFDLNGRLLISQNSKGTISEIDIRELISGVYLLKLTTEKGDVVKRIIKS